MVWALAFPTAEDAGKASARGCQRSPSERREEPWVGSEQTRLGTQVVTQGGVMDTQAVLMAASGSGTAVEVAGCPGLKSS